MSSEKISTKVSLFIALATLIIAAVNFYFDKIKDDNGRFSIILNTNLLEYTEEQGKNLHIIDFSVISNDNDSSERLTTDRFLQLKNNTKHTIKNCEVSVHYKCKNCKPILQNVYYQTDSTIIYKTNAIPPFGYIETPFYLYASIDSLSSLQCYYQMTYEGISAPIRFTYNLEIIFKHTPDTLLTPLRRDYLKRIKDAYPDDNQFFIFSINDTIVSSTGNEFNKSTIENFNSILEFKEKSEETSWGEILSMGFLGICVFIYFIGIFILILEIKDCLVEHLVKRQKRITVNFAFSLISKFFFLSCCVFLLILYLFSFSS